MNGKMILNMIIVYFNFYKCAYVQVDWIML